MLIDILKIIGVIAMALCLAIAIMITFMSLFGLIPNSYKSKEEK
jgi:hypothetical protein